MKKSSIFVILLGAILILPLTSAYYGGYLGGMPEQEYTVYAISKSSPYDSYEKTYTKTFQQLPGGEITTKTYASVENQLSYGYPSLTYKTYSTTRTNGFIYSDYPKQFRDCSSWRCQPKYNSIYYTNDYPDVFYYMPYYDANQGYYNWRW